MPAPKKGHYRVDTIRRPPHPYRGDEHETLEFVRTVASELTYKEAKRLQMSLYDKHGCGGPYLFWVVRGARKRKGETP